jgi:hypothetical protein
MTAACGKTARYVIPDAHRGDPESSGVRSQCTPIDSARREETSPYASICSACGFSRKPSVVPNAGA